MKKLVSFMVGLLLLAGSVSAKPVDVATARRVAETYMSAMGMKTPAALQNITAQTPFTEFYVFAAEEGGFILVSADDCVIPVLGYSTTNRFETKNVPEHVQAWFEAYEEEIRYWKAQEGRVELTVAGAAEGPTLVTEQWQMLTNGQMPPASLTTSVSPLLTTTWGQSPLYNKFCPAADDGSLSVAGCVATATAQVMKYWNYPATGYGNHTYTSSRVYNGVTYTFPNLTADFGATTYQWNNMPNALTASSDTVQINAVATLMYHLGVADEMKYSPHASGAQNYNTRGTIRVSSQTSLMKYFKYCPDMAMVMRADYSPEEYFNLMKAELDQSRPILFSGSNTSSGHSFVFDGYNTLGQVHVNWGWRGSNDGYFTLGSLNPGVGGIGGNSTGTYNLSNVALTHIRPNNNWNTSSTTTITTSATGNGTVYGAGTYSFGDTISLSATPDSGYRFTGWSDGTRFNPREVLANGGTFSFTAIFTPITGDTVTYCPGDYHISSYGYGTEGADKYWGIRIPASDVPTGKSLEKVLLYINDAGTYDLTIYTGANRTTTAVSQSYTFTSSDESKWKTISLGTNMVTTTEDIWITFHNTDVYYPANFTYNNGTNNSFLWGSSFDQVGAYWGVSAMIKAVFRADIPPTYEGDTISYCGSNASVGNAGTEEVSQLQWGINISQGDLDGYNYLQGVMLYVPSGMSGTYTLKVYQDGVNAPDTLVRTHPVTFSASQTGWQEVVFDDYLALEGHSLWITVSTTNLTYPIAYTTYNGSPRSDWYSVNNGAWAHFTQGSWMIKAITHADNCHRINTYPYSMGFGNSEMEAIVCWNTIDADGDGYCWRLYNERMRSDSWHSGAALTPDDWLVSPQFHLTAGNTYTLGWTVQAPSNYYYQEHYGVYVSTTGTDTASFTSLYENTLSDNDTHHLTLNLSTYAGQDIYVAFRHWNCADMEHITLDSITLTEVASSVTYTVTVNSNNPAWGTVTGGGTYTEGATATLTAIAATGYHFVRWNDNNTENPRMVTVTGDSTYTATFEADAPVQYTLTVQSNNTAWGTVTGGGTYDAGATAHLTATPKSGCRFVQWSDGDTNAIRDVTVTADGTYIATFVQNEGIEETEGVLWTLYPNPASSVVTIDGVEGKAEVTVTDMAGRTLGKFEMQNAKYEYDISHLSVGTYFLRIASGDDVVVRKLIVK